MKQGIASPSPTKERQRTATRGVEFPVIKKRATTRADGATATRQRQRTSPEKAAALPRVGTSSVTFAAAASRPPEVDNGEELEVLKCILVREGYLQRLERASAANKVSGSHLGETVDVLDLVRVATLEAVEAIVNWRRKTKRAVGDPYRWNSLNYLLKIPSDLDFLDKHTGLMQWLGFTLVRNPFVLPVPLDCCAKLSVDNPAIPRADSSLEDSTRFIEVGGKRRLEPQREADSRSSAAAAALAERKRAKNPYETRVLNDEDLLPSSLLRTSLPNAAKTPSSPVRPAPRGIAPTVLPSQIGELDMARILDASAVILEEESQCGRFARDLQGHVVPESEAQRRANMVELSGGAYKVTTEHQSVESSKKTDFVSGVAGSDDVRTETIAVNGDKASALPGKLATKKRTGLLGKITKPSFATKPVQHHPPRRRARGAQFEDALSSEKRALEQLASLIDTLREEAERKEMDVAYFESIAGLQHFGSELSDFVVSARMEVSRLRKELAEKRYVWECKRDNIARKEGILDMYKHEQKSVIDNQHRSEIDTGRARASSAPVATAPIAIADTNQKQGKQRDAELRTHKRAAPVVQHLCATLIQKMARGMLAREAFGRMRVEYTVSSKYIQAGVRGFLARRRVARLYCQRLAVTQIQRMARGMLARRAVETMRRDRLKYRSAVTIQKTVRGRMGRNRTTKVRRLLTARRVLVATAEQIELTDLQELAAECWRMVSVPSLSVTEPAATPLSPLVLGLVRLLMLFTSDGDTEWDIPNVRWREAATFLSCSRGLLRRMHKVALATETRYVRVSQLGVALRIALSGDRDFCVEHFQQLPRGWKAASAIFRWASAFATVAKLQQVLPPLEVADDEVDHGVFVVTHALTAQEKTQDRVEAQETAHGIDDTERRFVPAELVRAGKYPHHRPRAVVLVVAHDIPMQVKRRIVGKLMTLLPGLFVTVNRGASGKDTVASRDRESVFNFAAIREAAALGYGVVVESDIGLRDQVRGQFLSAFVAVKAALHPAPLCILVQGSVSNRGWSENDKSDSSTCGADQAMADADLKGAMETAAEQLFALLKSELADEMTTVIAKVADDPPLSLVLVMEAVIVLLTPGKMYEGPKPQAIPVSWKLAQRLLAFPAFFQSKLAAVRADTVPPDNLAALDRYLAHSEWPSRHRAHSLVHGAHVVFTLSAWVEATIKVAHLVIDGNGLAPSITRQSPVHGLFDSVVTYCNAPTEYAAAEDTTIREVLEASLTDVRVYRTAHPLDEGRCIVSVYHDCLRLFFSAYSPTSGHRWLTVIDESNVDSLLAPNSLERADVKRPPATRVEMYGRLVRLCVLEGRPSLHDDQRVDQTLSTAPISIGDVAKSVDGMQLAVRPRAVRLLRRVLRIGGQLATVTISELSRGHVKVDAFVHGSTESYCRGRVRGANNVGLVSMTVGLESVLDRLSAHHSRHATVQLSDLANMVLDRIHLFPTAPSRLRHSQVFRGTRLPTFAAQLEPEPIARANLNVQLCVRTTEKAPGHVLVRRAVRLTAPNGEVAVWLVSIVEMHVQGTFAAQLYQSRTCDRLSVPLSTRDLEDFLRFSRYTGPALLRRIMTKALRYKTTGQVHADIDDSASESDVELPDTTTDFKLCRVLARFPVALPVATDRHQLISKHRSVRAYVQVESSTLVAVDSAAKPGRSARCLVFHVWLPDSCDKHTLSISDCEIETWLPSGSAWALASTDTRRRGSRALVQSTFVWEEAREGNLSSGRVCSQLPSGVIVSRRTPLELVEQPSAQPPELAVQSTANADAPSSIQVTSCAVLLDKEDEDYRDGVVQPSKWCFQYGVDELVHRGTHRANGQLLVVRVHMKVVISERLVPLVPTDRVVQEDMLVVTFECYHPASSSRTTAAIDGRRQLREVVGPDRAALIASTSVQAMLRHIIEARMEVVLSPVEGNARPSTALQVVFLRDRLFAKHKVTPVTASLDADVAANASKLIDRASERGVKVLSAARVLDNCGRAILTFFDSGLAPEDRCWRVDAYVCSSSERISLVLSAADLAHVVGSRVSLFEQDQRRELARTVLDHVGVERRRDGRCARLFLTEYFIPAAEMEAVRDDKDKRTLLFKTVRAVSACQVVLTVFLVDVPDTFMAITAYEPSTSATGSIELPLATVAMMLGLPEETAAAVVSSDSGVPRSVLMTHLCSLVRVSRCKGDDQLHQRHDEGGLVSLTISLSMDQERTAQCRERFLNHCGDGAPTALHAMGAVLQRWIGPIVGTDGRYYALHLHLIDGDGKLVVLGSVFSPSAFVVATACSERVDVAALCGSEAVQPGQMPTDLLVHASRRVCVELETGHADDEMREAPALMLRLHFDW